MTAKRKRHYLLVWCVLVALYLGAGTFLSTLPMPQALAASISGFAASTTAWTLAGFTVSWIAVGGRYGGTLRAASATLLTLLAASLISYSLQLWYFGASSEITAKLREQIPHDIRSVAILGLSCAAVATMARSAIRWLSSAALGIIIGVLAYEPTMTIVLNKVFASPAATAHVIAGAIAVIAVLAVLIARKMINIYVVVGVAIATTTLLVKISYVLSIAPQNMLTDGGW